MPFTLPPDLSTPVGRVRTLIPDLNPDAVMFQDEELELFLQLENGVLRFGVALALETIASNMAMVDKVMTLHDLETDSRATAETLMKRAELLRAQGDEASAQVIEYGDLTAFNARDYQLKKGDVIIWL